MRYLAPIPSQFLDENGEPYYGGMVHVYVHGEMRHAEIYQNAQTDELAQNPFPLDSHGSWQAFVDADKTFDYIVKDSGGNVVARFPEITFPTGEGVPEVSVVSPDWSINVNEVVDETGKTFEIEVNRDILEPSYSEFSHDTVNGNGGAAVLDSFTLEIDADADIYLTEGVLTFKKGLYHVSMNLVIGNSVESGAYYDIVVNFGGNELKKTWDGSFVHEESVELGMDVTADQDGHTVIPSIVELPEGMYCRVSRLDVHKVGGAGVGGSGAPIEHDGSLEGDGTHGNPLGVKDYSEIRTDLAEVIEGLDTHKTDPFAHQDIRDELERKEDKDNKVTSWGSTPSDEKFPSEKLVKDTLDNLPPGTAVKGDAESEYRTGNVNLTTANIGAATASQGAKADSAVQGVKVNGTELSKDSNNMVDVPVPTAFAATPLKDGTASAGSSSQWARGDHVHPTDDSREAVNNKKQVVNDSSTTEYPSSKAVADFVNSSVATNTANFLGTISESSLGLDYTATNEQIALALNVHSWESTPTNNDYCFVSVNDPQTTDVDEYRRFKFNGSVWAYEYTLNNSSFTQAQWDAINSGLTSSDRTAYNAAVTLLSAHVGDGSIHVTSSEKNAWNDKYTKPSTGIPKTDLASDVQTSLGKADSALQGHQSVTDNNPTLAWGTTSKVGTVGSTDLRVTMPSNPASGKLDSTGDASNTTSTFTKASGDSSSMTSGGKMSAIFTAISSFFASLKALAFKDKVSDNDINGTISDSHIASASAWNGKQNSLGISASGDTGKFLNERGSFTTPNYPSVDQDFTNTTSTRAISTKAVYQRYFNGKIGLNTNVIRLCRIAANFSNYRQILKININWAVNVYGDSRMNVNLIVRFLNNIEPVSVIQEVFSLDGNQYKFGWVADTANGHVDLFVTYGNSITSLAGRAIISISSSDDNAGLDYSVSPESQDTYPTYTNSVSITRSFPRINSNTSIGSPTTPVYVDSNGQVQPCDLSQMGVCAASYAEKAKEGCKGSNTATLYIAGTFGDGNIPYYHVKDVKNGCINYVHVKDIPYNTCSITIEAPTLASGEEYDYVVVFDTFTNSNLIGSIDVENCKTAGHMDNGVFVVDSMALMSANPQYVPMIVVTGNVASSKWYNRT